MLWLTKVDKLYNSKETKFLQRVTCFTLNFYLSNPLPLSYSLKFSLYDKVKLFLL